jgi:hypothetical protein
MIVQRSIGNETQTEARRIIFPGELRFAFRLALLFAFGWLLAGCSSARVEEAPTPATPTQVAQQAKAPDTSPPKLEEVQQAVTRVFKDSALLEPNHNPNYFVGDFNGDLAPDLVVVLKVAPGKVAEINEEFPVWMTRDPFAQTGAPRPKVEDKDVLLAIIHGYGPSGWRDSQATQTYLLKNAVGSDMKVEPGKAFVAANQGKKLPRIHGDLISEALRGTSGYLYYAQTTYAWYDPNTFKGEPEKRLVHAPRTPTLKPVQ